MFNSARTSCAQGENNPSVKSIYTLISFSIAAVLPVFTNRLLSMIILLPRHLQQFFLSCLRFVPIRMHIPLLTLTFISVAFSPRQLGIGIHFQTLLTPLLKVPMMVLLSLLWLELGTNLPGPGPGE